MARSQGKGQRCHLTWLFGNWEWFLESVRFTVVMDTHMRPEIQRECFINPTQHAHCICACIVQVLPALPHHHHDTWHCELDQRRNAELSPKNNQDLLVDSQQALKNR